MVNIVLVERDGILSRDEEARRGDILRRNRRRRGDRDLGDRSFIIV